MPDQDGFALASWVRQAPDIGQTPIVMLTSGGRLGDQELRSSLKIAANLIKPVKQSELLQTITRVLGLNGYSEKNKADISPSSDEGPLKILLVEDSLFNQRLAITLLESEGHAVTVADNGRLATEAVCEHDFDVVLMDVQMPVMDGMEATRHIRQRERGKAAFPAAHRGDDRTRHAGRLSAVPRRRDESIRVEANRPPTTIRRDSNRGFRPEKE